MKSKKTSYLLPIVSQDFRTSRSFVLDLFETQFLIDRLMQFGDNVVSAAQASGMSEEDFTELLGKHRINVCEFSALRKVIQSKPEHTITH